MVSKKKCSECGEIILEDYFPARTCPGCDAIVCETCFDDIYSDCEITTECDFRGCSKCMIQHETEEHPDEVETA